MNELLYIAASCIEALSVFILMLQLFRYHALTHLRFIVIASIAFSLLAYALRVKFDFNSYFIPISIAYFTIFVFYILKTPLFWALIISTITYVAIAVFQTIFVLLLDLFSSFNIEDISQMSYKSRLLQITCALLSILISNYLYKRGIGFAFNFDKFRLKWENILMLIVSLLLFLALFVTFFNNEFYFFAIISLIIFSFLLYFALRKERADLD